MVTWLTLCLKLTHRIKLESRAETMEDKAWVALAARAARAESQALLELVQGSRECRTASMNFCRSALDSLASGGQRVVALALLTLPGRKLVGPACPHLACPTALPT